MNPPITKPNKILLILSLGAILVITWRVLTIGISEYYVAKALEGDIAAIQAALSWNASHPKAQYLQARQILESDPTEAEKLLRASLLSDPTNIDALQAMATLQLAAENKQAADKLMAESTRLAPANKFARTQAGLYWARSGQIDLAVAEWDAALTTSTNQGAEIFPILLRLAQSDETVIFLEPLIKKPPVWWPDFVKYMVKNAESLDTLVHIAALRMKSNVPLSAEERTLVVRRMMKDGEWPQAYITWVNGLDDTQRRYLGSIYNGSFKLEPTNEGFDWHITNRKKGVTIRHQRSYGSAGEKAMQLAFDGHEFIFTDLYQPLYLTIGQHEFWANVKTDRLSTRGGLKWVVRCAMDDKIVLGESPRMLGSSEWREVRFGFKVPDTPECSKGQILRLESTGENTFDHKIKGEIWFDRLAIRTIRQPAAPLTKEEQAAKDKSASEQAAKNKTANENAARKKTAREQAAREKAATEKAAREQAAREKAARVKAEQRAAREKAAREKAEQQAAREKAAREKAEQQAAIAREKAARERAELQAAAAREKAARENAEQQAAAAREKAAREQAAREKAQQEAAEREKFVIELPVEASTQLTESKINALLAAYVSAYNSGNIEEMTKLFSETVETDDGQGIDIIQKDYSKLFNSSGGRRFTVQNVQWKIIGEAEAIINFVANVQIRPIDSQEWKTYSGDMQFNVSSTDRGLQITRSTHSVRAIE